MMTYPITLSVTIVQLTPEDTGLCWVYTRTSAPDAVSVRTEFPLGILDDPTDVQDYARQALAQVVEAL